MYADPLPANAELFTRQAKGLFIFAPVNSRSSIREIGKFVEEHGFTLHMEFSDRDCIPLNRHASDQKRKGPR